jgi:hypothetical protein
VINIKDIINIAAIVLLQLFEVLYIAAIVQDSMR